MKKSIIEKIKALFEQDEETMRFIEVKTKDGKILRTDDMLIGSEIKEITEDGEVVLEDGEYVTEEDFIITVESGLIVDIKEPMVEELGKDEKVKEKMANVMRTDGVAIYYDGTELVAGETKLFLDEELTQPAPEGHHLLEGGLIVMIQDGVLVSIDEVPQKKEEVVEEEEVNEFEVGVLSALQILKDELESLKQENQKLKQRFNKFASEPSAEPIETKVDFSKLDKKQIREERLKFFGKK